MVDKIQDLNLPATVVTRLIKEALPDGINIGKEARSAIARAASIFSKYIRKYTGQINENCGLSWILFVKNSDKYICSSDLLTIGIFPKQ